VIVVAGHMKAELTDNDWGWTKVGYYSDRRWRRPTAVESSWRRVAASEGSVWPFVTGRRSKPSLLVAGCGAACWEGGYM